MVILPSEAVAVLGVIDPDAYSTGVETSDWCDMQDFSHAMVIALLGDMTSSGAFDVRVLQATSSTGADSKAITGKAITQFTSADSNKQAIINIKQEDLDIANSFRYIAAEQTVSVAASDASTIVLGFFAKYGPANTVDLASVDEIV